MELISVDGEIKIDAALTMMTSCGGSMDSKVVSKFLEKLMSDCGFQNRIRKKRSADSLYKLAVSSWR